MNSEIVKWAVLEYAQRIALQQTNKLLEAFATIEDRDVKELLSHVITIGGEYVSEIERQKENDDIASSEHYIDLLKIHLDAVWWIDALASIYQTPREREKTMSDLLQSAADFFSATIEAEMLTSVKFAESETSK